MQLRRLARLFWHQGGNKFVAYAEAIGGSDAVLPRNGNGLLGSCDLVPRGQVVVGSLHTFGIIQNDPMTLDPSTQAELLLAIAARADNEHIATLTPAEFAFAMTLEGRRLLHSVQLGSPEFRLSRSALEWLARRAAEAMAADTSEAVELRVLKGGSTGVNPRSSANWRVSLPS